MSGCAFGLQLHLVITHVSAVSPKGFNWEDGGHPLVLWAQQDHEVGEEGVSGGG